jgi:hypothetical protein
MKYNSILSLTGLNGKFVRSTPEEKERYKEARVHVTEKIDGENWRIGIVDGRRMIGSRNHAFYWDDIAKEFIHDFTHKPHPNWDKINETTKDEIFGALSILEVGEYQNIILYGELYGNGLQGNFQFDHDGYAAIYYEVSIDEKYIDQLDAFALLIDCGLVTVPFIGTMTLQDFLDIEVEDMKSQVATNPFIEGVVAIPVGGSFDWEFRARFCVKKKIKRFSETKVSKKSREQGKKKYTSPFAIHVTENRLKHVLQELEEDGHLLSQDSDFRKMVVEAMIVNISNEENNEEEFEKRDRQSLARETHRLFSEYSSRID